jgi:hypothetical protein
MWIVSASGNGCNSNRKRVDMWCEWDQGAVTRLVHFARLPHSVDSLPLPPLPLCRSSPTSLFPATCCLLFLVPLGTCSIDLRSCAHAQRQRSLRACNRIEGESFIPGLKFHCWVHPDPLSWALHSLFQYVSWCCHRWAAFPASTCVCWRISLDNARLQSKQGKVWY